MNGHVLRELRKSAQMTQSELAQASGVNQAHISDLESGKADNPSLTTLEGIAVGLKIPVDELVRRLKNGIEVTITAA